jgi:integrating conjugative element protein (TIGR03749 family)
MKRIITLLCMLLGANTASAIEILHWRRLPLSIPLTVGEERVIFIERAMRIGMPADLKEDLRVQSANGAIYLRPNNPIPATRIQLQDVETGALILLDITAEAAHGTAREPVQIVTETRNPPPGPAHVREIPLPVILTRHAAQNLYAPLHAIEPVPGILRAPLGALALDTLMPGQPIELRALAAWRLEDRWVTAVLLRNRSRQRLSLDPRRLQGDFETASFQHPDLGPAGEPEDTSMLYLVTRGKPLAAARLPVTPAGDAHEK